MSKDAKIITFPGPITAVGPMLQKKSSLDTLSNQALCKLRDDPRKGHKVAPKYEGPHGEKWSGRGLKPRWLTAAMSEGKRPEDFLIRAPKKNNVSQARH
jgi:DNA-binding protein H-NS